VDRTIPIALAVLMAVATLPMAAGSIPVADEALQDEGTEAEDPSSTAPDTERAVFVGNNWEGTADVLQFDPEEGEFAKVATIDVIPDYRERLIEMLQDPERLGYYIGIRLAVGEGNDQYADDMYTTKDGETLVVSRPSLADVVGIDLRTNEIEWRFEVDGQRSDHMGLSPDGERVAVSASTGNVVHVLDMETGEELWKARSGDSPHENIYSADGDRIYHASIGRVYLPNDRPMLQDPGKGQQVFQVIDTQEKEVETRVDMGEKLAEAGHEGTSSAVRPMTLTPDETTAYLQVSFFHGYIEYDLVNHEVVDVVELPNRVPDMPREQYPLDSAHHGIELNEAGDKLCVSGTVSDYAAIVPVENPEDLTMFVKGEGDEARSYWSTLSDDGEHCFVSWSGLDRVSAISFEDEAVVDEVDVGDHPQRIRTGDVPSDWVAEQMADVDAS
jgi:DNA-binding beta-propeller fold protein YncE